MSSANLAVPYRARPDTVRIAALSAAIALNLTALIFALRPLAPQIAEVLDTNKVETAVRIIEPPPKAPPPPDIVLKRLPTPAPVIAPIHLPIHVEHVAPPQVTTPPTVELSQNSKPISLPPALTPPQTMAPGVLSLAYRSSPLRFPAQAMRQRMQGTVLLRVLVDESGKPVDVVIEHSSGYALLDKSARDQVLSSWLFQAAVMDGHAVKAWARVPVSFSLQEL